MSLDPSASPWPGVLASVGVCLWIVAIGAPLAAAAFRHRARLVWPFYAPILGVVTVLLVTNLAAYAIPGAPAAWFGLIAPTVAAAVVAWRLGVPRQPTRRTAPVLLALGLLAVGMFALAYANQLHEPIWDSPWHYGLAHQMARGVFPPVTPFGVDASPGYHYGHNLLTASIVGTTGAMPWAAFDALAAFLVAVLVLAVAGFAYDVGAPLLFALVLGTTVGLLGRALLLGIHTGYLAGGDLLDHSILRGEFRWLKHPQWALAMGLVVLVAAALHAGVARRHAAVLAAGAGVFALAEAAVMIFACTALALLGAARLLRLRGRDRLVFAGALATSAFLVVLAGGPVSDAIFDRGGTAGMVRLVWDPRQEHLLPFEPVGPVLVKVGIPALAALGAVAAVRQRSWGLGYLTVAAVLGLVEAAAVRPAFPSNAWRIIGLAHAVAMIGALAGLGALIGSIRPRVPQALVGLAIGLFLLLPTGLPRAIAIVHLALDDMETANPAADSSGHHYRDRTTFGEHLEANWEIYAWLRRSLPNDARLLSLHTFTSVSAAGIAAPRSDREFQAFSERVSTPAYTDAVRFLHRDDLAAMGITHLHLSDYLESQLSLSARRLLDDPSHFTLLADIDTAAGMRHRVFAVRPGAGTTDVDPSSVRALRRNVPTDAPITTLGALTISQRQAIFAGFADRDDLHAAYGTDLDRATQVPRVTTIRDLPARGVVILREPLEPTALGLTRDEALWRGNGLRAYDLAAAWSPAARAGPHPAPLPESLRSVCDAAPNGQLDLRVLGEPGTALAAGPATLTLTGLPQILTLTVPDCAASSLSAPAAVAPFVQARPHQAATRASQSTPVAALGFDGGVDDDHVVLNFWYRNPLGVPFVTSTEFRLYAASPLGVGQAAESPNPRAASLRWWPGPLVLQASEQNARIEFDARRLEINGDGGGGSASQLEPGRTYLLALTVAGVDPRRGLMEIQHIVPLARVVVGDAGVAYEVFTGIAVVEHDAPGTIFQRTGYDGGLGTPDPERRPR